MPRMSKNRKLKWQLFINHRNRVTYNDLCRKCIHGCKQSFRVVVMDSRAIIPNAPTEEGRVECRKFQKRMKPQAGLKETVAALEAEISGQEQQTANVDSFLALVRRTNEIEKLTPAIVHEFIEKIIIYAPEQARGDRCQKVEIIYNNIGAVDPQS